MKIQHQLTVERDIDRWLNEGGRDFEESRRQPGARSASVREPAETPERRVGAPQA